GYLSMSLSSEWDAVGGDERARRTFSGRGQAVEWAKAGRAQHGGHAHVDRAAQTSEIVEGMCCRRAGQPGANVERARTLPEQRLAVKDYLHLERQQTQLYT